MSSSQNEHQHQYHHEGTLRYKVGIVMLLYLQAMSMIWTSSRLHGGGDCYHTVEQALSIPLPPPDCAHDNSNSSSSIIRAPLSAADSNTNNNDPCSILMNKFHQINAKFRQQGHNASYQPQPYFNYAYYADQGFGRLVDHSSLHCVLALHLGRPCVLDLSTRDPYFTWRTFIHTGTYNWEMQTDNSHWLEDYYREEIDRAVSEMKQIGGARWENGIQNITSYKKLFLLNDEPPTWPAKGKLLLPDFYKNIESWRPKTTAATRDLQQPQQQQPDDKAILSPNWGMWFPRLEMPFKAQGCKLPELLTRMQTALWQPTPLTLHLHKLRADRYLSDDKNKNKGNSSPKKATTTALSAEPYGAIHIRTFFLKQGQDGEQRMRQLQPTLEKCLDMIVTRPKFNISHIKKWWILADKHFMAVNLANNISSRFDIRHGYDDAAFVANNEHSRLPSAQDVLAHKLMAPSVLDWTVLHQSQVAVITSGSFGISGARGRGKQYRQTCGGYLQVYY
jgi:hypothetical protein